MKLSSLQDTKNFSETIAKILRNGDIIFLYGQIGTGKTTFVRFLINYLENKNKINQSDILSPTFNIVYDYEIGEKKILHYDLYRIKNNNDIFELGMFEQSKEHIKIIEWPELITPKPKDRIEIMFEIIKLNNTRNIEIVGYGKWKDYKFNEN